MDVTTYQTIHLYQAHGNNSEQEENMATTPNKKKDPYKLTVDKPYSNQSTDAVKTTPSGLSGTVTKPSGNAMHQNNSQSLTGVNGMNDAINYFKSKDRQQAYSDGYNNVAQANTVNPAATTTYEQNAPGAYQSQYSGQIQSILNGILNGQKFSYDVNTDPLYKQYAEQYQRQGNLAMRDTVGNVAALSGGYGNSYAATAGSQTYDQYMQSLNDKVPELYQLAYQQYQDNQTNQYNQLNALNTLDQQNYSQYRDTVGDYQTDRNYYYTKDYNDQQQQNYQDQFAYQQQQDAQNYAYQQGRDKVSDSQWNQSMDYQKQQDAQNYAYQQGRDTVSDSQWDKNYNMSLDQLAYQKQQDAIAAQQAKQASAQQASAAAAKAEAAATTASQKAITTKTNTYSKEVKSMLGAMTTGTNGEKVNTYTVEDVYKYLDDSLSNDSEADKQVFVNVINSNYELMKYVEELNNNAIKQQAAGGRRGQQVQERV